MKLGNLRAILFKPQLRVMRGVMEQIKNLDEGLWLGTALTITKQYADEKGAIQWSAMKKDIMSLLSNINQEIGMRQAIAAGRADVHM